MANQLLRRLLGTAPAPRAKASAANGVTLLQVAMPGPITHPKFDALARETFERNVTVYSCVMGIATAASTVPWVAYEKSRATDNPTKARRIMSRSTAQKAFLFDGRRRHAVRKALEITEVSDIPALSLLERPNPWQSQAAYLTGMVAWFLLSGNAYEEFVATNERGAVPREMYALRPDRTSVVANTVANRAKYPGLVAVGRDGKPVDASELVLGYSYEVGSSRPKEFSVDSVIHRKFFHPTSDFYGFSPLQAATRTWQTDNLATDWNMALIKNQARPSGALIAPTALADDAAFERLKQEITSTYNGSDAAGLPIFLEGGLDWKQFSFSPIELDWSGGKSMSQIDICSVFHWPPELIGSAAHRTFNSMPEARRAGWIDAVLPILDSIRDEYNARLAPRFSDRLFFDYDRDQIDALAEDQQRVWLRVGGSDFISVNEQREAVGYDLYDDPAADVPRVIAGLGGAAAPALPEQLTGEQKPEDVKPVDGEPLGDNNLRQAEKALLAHRQKSARLSTRQRRQLALLRAAMKRFFRTAGPDVARHVGTAIAREL